MKITVEIPIEPRQKYCVDKKTREYCPYIISYFNGKPVNCVLFWEALQVGKSGYQMRCKQCKEAEKRNEFTGTI